MTMMKDSQTIKKDFPIFTNKKISYLDSGATTQKPTQVIDAINEFYKNHNANPKFKLSLAFFEKIISSGCFAFMNFAILALVDS